MSAQSTTMTADSVPQVATSEKGVAMIPTSSANVDGKSEEQKMEMWYPRWKIYHTYSAAAISVLVALASSISKIANTNISENTEMVLLIGCVGLLGIPHGASDHVVIANTLHSRFGNFWLPAFLVVYLGLVAAVLYFWQLTPVIALFTFIGVSAIHFGLGDVDKEMAGPMYWLEVPIRGFMIMVLPCVHHTHNVDRIWTWLVGNEEQNASVQDALVKMHMLMPIWYAGICSVVIWHQYQLYMTAKQDGLMSFNKKVAQTKNDITGAVQRAIESPTFKGRRLKPPASGQLRKRHGAVPVQTVADKLAAAEAKKGKEVGATTLKSIAAKSPVRAPNPLDVLDTKKDWISSPVLHHHAIIIELFSIYALFASTTPLVAFIVYFCIWHSARHNFMVAATCFDREDAVKALVSFFWASVPFSLGALAMGYGGFVYLNDAPENVVKVQLRMVFIGLNALTIPHMMFIELSDLRGRVAAGKCANFIGMVMGTINMRSSTASDLVVDVGKKMTKTSPRIP